MWNALVNSLRHAVRVCLAERINVNMFRMATQNNPQRSIAPRLKAMLANKNMSGRELARRLDMTPVYVSRRLRGEVEPSASDLAAIADVLGVSVGSLFGEVDQ